MKSKGSTYIRIHGACDVELSLPEKITHKELKKAALEKKGEFKLDLGLDDVFFAVYKSEKRHDYIFNNDEDVIDLKKHEGIASGFYLLPLDKKLRAKVLPNRVILGRIMTTEASIERIKEDAEKTGKDFKKEMKKMYGERKCNYYDWLGIDLLNTL